MKPRTVYEAIELYHHDEDFEPVVEAKPTEHAPGTLGKIEAMRRRVELGLPLWSDDDNDTHDSSSNPILRGAKNGYQARIREYRQDGDFFETVGGGKE